MTFIQPTGGGGGLVTQDLSTFAELDPNSVRDAASSLGATSTIVAATNHGAVDAGLDPWSLTLDLGAKPAGARTLYVKTVCGTSPTEDPGSSAAAMLMYVGPSATLTNTEGYVGGLMRAAAPSNLGSSVTTMGSKPATGGATLVGVDLVGEMFVLFEGTTGRSASVYCSGGTSGVREIQTTVDSGGTFTNVFVGLCVCQYGGAPSDIVTWGDVTFQTMWME